jgi:hypothetical protein
MVDFFTNIYSSIKNKNSFLVKIRFYSLLRVVVRQSANLILPVYFHFTKEKFRLSEDKNNVDDGLIVSFTSFPARIKKVHLVVESILRQTVLPDRIILWLSKEQFPTIDSLPKKLLEQRKRGLEINLCEGDLRSHKKYYYTLQELPNSSLITIDDDILYPSNMIETLLEAHNKYPDAIIARYGNKIKVSSNIIRPYREWGKNYVSIKPDDIAFFGSGGGTLFPKESFPSFTLRKDIFLSVCPLADDVWLNSMIRINNKKVYLLKTNKDILFPIVNRKNKTLSSQNLGEDLNDVQINNVRDYFIKEYNIDPFRKVFE